MRYARIGQRRQGPVDWVSSFPVSEKWGLLRSGGVAERRSVGFGSERARSPKQWVLWGLRDWMDGESGRSGG